MEDKVRRTPEEALDQAERVWQMRVHEGVPHRTIAKREGVSQQRVSQLLQMIRDQIPPRDIDHLVQEAVDRYEFLRGAYRAKAAAGDKDAVKILLSIEAEMRKLLGLDQPTRVEQSGGVRYEVTGLNPSDLT